MENANLVGVTGPSECTESKSAELHLKIRLENKITRHVYFANLSSDFCNGSGSLFDEVS